MKSTIRTDRKVGFFMSRKNPITFDIIFSNPNDFRNLVLKYKYTERKLEKTIRKKGVLYYENGH